MSNELERELTAAVRPPMPIKMTPAELGGWLADASARAFAAGWEAGIQEYVDLEGYMPPTVDERYVAGQFAFQRWFGPKTEES